MTQQGGGVSPSQKSVKLGENYGELPVPTRAGYVFCGWRNASNEYVTADMQYIIIGPEKLTAHWRQPIAYLSSDWKTRITNAATPTSANLSGSSKDDYVLTAPEPTLPDADPSYPFVTVTITSSLSAASGLSNSLSIGTNNETSTDAFSSGEYFYDVTAYFDNNKQTVVIYSPYTIYAPANSIDLFGYCDKMTSVTFGNLNTSKTTNMRGWFVKNYALTSIDVSTFDTSKVSNMRYLFQDCSALTSIDVSKFKTSNVTDMTSMFYNCSAATTINVSGLNTSNVTDMCSMFYHCSSVTSLAVSGFNTSKVTDMSCMFDGCTKLVTADTSGFDGTKCTSFGYMFRNCSAYKTAVLPKGLVTTGTEMYYNCTSLSSVTLPTTCTTISNTTFRDTDSLKSIDLKNVKTINTDAFWSGGLTGELVCPASNIGFDAFGSNKLTSVKFTHTGTITLGKTAFRNNSSLTTLDFLAQGANFKSNSFSTENNGVWEGCDIRYVKVTQDNFGKELMAQTTILEIDDKETTTGYTYIYVPGYVYFHYTVNCWGWTWTAYSTPELQGGSGTEKNLPTINVTCGLFAGDTEKSSTATEQGSGLPAKYGSLAVRVYNSCTKGGSLVKVTIYGIGSLNSTEWNKIVSSGYNFRCNATTYRPSGHVSIATNMNAYCYPNYIDYWICQY